MSLESKTKLGTKTMKELTTEETLHEVQIRLDEIDRLRKEIEELKDAWWEK